MSEKKCSCKKVLLIILAIIIVVAVVLCICKHCGCCGSCKSDEATESVTAGAIDPFAAEMVLVKGGTFTMGATADQGADVKDCEKPAHEVTLSDYYIAQYEVTQVQWNLIMDSNPSEFEGEALPVENVSWNDIQEFITKLNEITGKEYRLPTEAEWEYAARGGSESAGYMYSGGNDPLEVMWCSENGEDQTHPVKQKAPNELGLYDMSGNVWEWCSDYYADYSADAVTDPKGPESGDNDHVIRGGGWDMDPNGCRVASRTNYRLSIGNQGTIGFRLAL